MNGWNVFMLIALGFAIGFSCRKCNFPLPVTGMGLLVREFLASKEKGYLPLVEYLEARMEPFPGFAHGSGHYAGVHIDDDIYGYEVSLGFCSDGIDINPSAYGLKPSEGKRLFEAILSCVPGSVPFVDKHNLNDPRRYDMGADHFNDLAAGEQERLALLIEECSEVIHIAGKILRQGYNSCHPDNDVVNNRMLLEEELGHVFFAVELMSDRHDVQDIAISDHCAEKRARVGKYLHHNIV